MAVVIEWDGPLTDLRIPIQELIDQVFGSQEGFNAEVVRLLPLSGAESGAAVLRAIMTSPQSPLPYILKCGEAEIIDRELASHQRWNSSTTLWNGAPLHPLTTPPRLQRGGVTWSAALYRLAGNTGSIEDLLSLDEAVGSFTDGESGPHESSRWAATFNTLARTLATSYQATQTSGSAARVLAVPSRELRAVVSSVAASASDASDPDVAGWHELETTLPAWEEYVGQLHREVRLVLCHGDLRGANVLLDGETFHPFIIDFGSVGIGSPLMDLARLEIDLLVRAGNLDESALPAVHQMLFDEYCDAAWEHSDVKALRVVYHLRRAFERVTHQGVQTGRVLDEIRFFHSCRISTAARMLRWADRSVTSRNARRHLLWLMIEGTRRVLQSPRGGSRVMRPLPRQAGPIVRQTSTVGINAVHSSTDWPARNAAKKSVLESTDDLWLMAHSGWSYMAPEGALFEAMEQRTRRSRSGEAGFSRIIIMSPYTEEGIVRAAQQNPRATTLEGLETTRTFTRFSRCLSDFQNLFMDDETPDPRVELRVSTFSIGVTVLLAGGTMFYEPYHAGLASRRDVKLQTFPEFEFSGPSGAAYVSAVREQIEWQWDRALSIDDYLAQESAVHERSSGYTRRLLGAPAGEARE
ncbi:aminoglycoside phosphotransferase family protein [Streptomyces sp. NPDC004726]